MLYVSVIMSGRPVVKIYNDFTGIDFDALNDNFIMPKIENENKMKSFVKYMMFGIMNAIAATVLFNFPALTLKWWIFGVYMTFIFYLLDSMKDKNE